MFKVRKDWWNVNYIQSYATYTKKFAKPVSHTSMSERVVPWRSVSCDNLQDSPVELIRVCKRSAVEKSLETLHSPREGVGGAVVVRKLQAVECKGRRNKYFSF